MNPWIVIVAAACAPNPPNVVNAVNIPPTVYLAPVAPAPSIAVYRASSRAEAEALAIGYRERKLGSGIAALEPTRPSSSYNCSESLVVIAPDGKVYSVSRQQKTKKVTRVVDEPDGTEIVWTEQP